MGDDTLITPEDVKAAFSDILDVAPELMEYVLTCYPPELMIHLPPDLREQVENAYFQSAKENSN